MKLLLLAGTIALLVTTAWAADHMGVFGIALGQPLQLAPCPQPSLDARQPVPMCVLMGNPLAPQRTLDTGALESHVKWAYDGTNRPGPDYSKENEHLMVDTLENKVVALWFSTKGASVQEEVLATLTTKYGKPTVLDRKKKQTAFGVVIPYLSAYWKLPDVVVLFDGVTDRIDDGTVSISTPAYSRLTTETFQRRKSAQPQL